MSLWVVPFSLGWIAGLYDKKKVSWVQVFIALCCNTFFYCSQCQESKLGPQCVLGKHYAPESVPSASFFNKKHTFLFILCVFTCLHTCEHTPHRACQRTVCGRQFYLSWFSLLPYESWGLNSGCEACYQPLFYTEPSHWTCSLLLGYGCRWPNDLKLLLLWCHCHDGLYLNTVSQKKLFHT